MTNPDNTVGTNAGFDGRTTPNAFNDILGAFTRGIVSGWACSPKSGMTVQLGGDGTTRDVAIAEDNAGNKTTINNRTATPVEITLAGAPATGNRIDSIVAYVDSAQSGQGATDVDFPSITGIIAVSGTAAGTPTAPTEAQIRTAITNDGADGASSFYVVLANITVGQGVTTIGSGVITQGDVVISNAQLADSSVTSDKIDWTTFDYSGANSTPVTVGTSYVTLVTLPIASGGLYFLIANVTRGVNSGGGAIIHLNFQKNSNDLRTFTAPTVPNYAGNHEPTNVGFVVFSASVGDSVKIRVKKDRNDYGSPLGTQYSLVKIA